MKKIKTEDRNNGLK